MNKYYFEKISPRIEKSAFLNQIQEYAENNKIQIYVLSSPLAENRFEGDSASGYVVLTPKHRILFVQCTEDDDEFEDYKEDTKEDIAFISKKYDADKIIGRKRSWKDLFEECKESEDLDFSNMIKRQLLIDRDEYRRIDILISLFIGSINESSKIRLDEPENLLDKIKYKIQLFDTDQTLFIYEELNQKIIRIQGLAGTGKTELLLHKLKDIYISDPDSKIALTCHNRVLANSLTTRLPEFFNSMKVEKQIEWNKRLWCFNAWGRYRDWDSGFLRLVCHTYELPFLSYRDAGDFDSACKFTISKLKENFKSVGISPFLDYVFIDESQDFEDSFIELADLVTRKKVYLAGDVFQSIFEDRSIDKLNTDFLLSRCYRTDPKTLMFAQGLGMGLFEQQKLYWMDKEKWKICGYSVQEDIANNTYTLTREPIRRFEDLSADYNSLVIGETDDITDYVVTQIKSLIVEYPDIQPSDICIIFLDNENYIYGYDNRLGQAILKETEWDYILTHEKKDVQPNCVTITNRNNIKGLEFPFVFCITRKITRDHSYRNAIYTMLSRSFLRSYLVVCGGIDSGLTTEMKNGARHIMQHKNMIVKIPTEEEIAVIKQDFDVSHKSKSLRERIEIIMNMLDIPIEKINQVISSLEQFQKKDFTDEQLESFIRGLQGIFI